MTKYDFHKIQALLREAEKKKMDFDEKWTWIGRKFGVSKEAVRKGYYRAREEVILKNDQNAITSDQWRTAYLVLTGKSSRDQIDEIKQKIVQLCGLD